MFQSLLQIVFTFILGLMSEWFSLQMVALLDEMIRSGAASWHDNTLNAAPYQAPQSKWMNNKIKPKDWKPQNFSYS